MPKTLRLAMLSCVGCTLMLLVTCGLACNVFSAAQPYILAGNGFTNTQTSLITTIRSAAYLLGTLAVGRYSCSLRQQRVLRPIILRGLSQASAMPSARWSRRRF